MTLWDGVYYLYFTSCAKAGDDESEEGEKERRGSSKVWDLDGVVQLVGEQDQKHQEGHHEEAVAQGRVGGGASMVSVDIGHAQKDAGEDDGVEDTHQGDAEHYPERDEGDLPGPGDDAAS